MDNKLYTGFGDKGYTRTLKNMRISKSDSLIELLGTLDEFSASLGVSKAMARDKMLIKDIDAVQRKIIDISGEVAGGKVTTTNDCVSYIEHLIDKYQSYVGEFDGFTISGVNQVSANLNMARTIIRRAERAAVKVGQFGRIQSAVLVYINRLSDLVYAMSRYSEDNKTKNMQTEAVDVVMNNSVPQGKLTLALAKEVSLAVEAEAMSMGLSVVVAILDEGANLMLLHSMDNAYIASCKIAQDKAYTSVSLKMSSQTALVESRGGVLDGLSATTGNNLLLLGGGEPLRINGRIVGGIGVSGGTAEQDIYFAEFGAKYLEGRI